MFGCSLSWTSLWRVHFRDCGHCREQGTRRSTRIADCARCSRLVLWYPSPGLRTSVRTWECPSTMVCGACAGPASRPAIRACRRRRPCAHRSKRLRTLNGLCLWTWRAPLRWSPDPTGVRLVRLDQAAGYPGCGGSTPGAACRSAFVAHGADLFAARGEDPTLGVQTLDGPSHSRRAARLWWRTVVGRRILARSVLESLDVTPWRPPCAPCHSARRRLAFTPASTPGRRAPLRSRCRIPGSLTVARLDFTKGRHRDPSVAAIRARHFPSARYAVAGFGSRRGSLEAL